VENLFFARSELAPEFEDITGSPQPPPYYFDIICADKGNIEAQEK
jgi:hypothetical protein